MTNFSIIQISDLHFSAPSDYGISSFLSKRFLGGLNVFISRRYLYTDYIREKLSRYLLDEVDYDHLLVSGDLTSTSTNGEFSQARDYLLTLKEKSPVSLVPGNHDIYIKGSRELFLDYFGKDFDFTQYPHLVKCSEKVILLCFDTCFPAPLLSSEGRITQNDLDAAADLLSKVDVENTLVLVSGHYHLKEKNSKSKNHDMIDVEKLIKFLSDNKLKYYFHGHLHKRFLLQTAGINLLNSGSSASSSPKLPATFHKYNFSGTKLSEVEVHSFNHGSQSFELSEKISPPFELI